MAFAFRTLYIRLLAMELPSGEDLGFVRPKASANSGNFFKKVHYESKLDAKANTYLV